MGFIAEESSRGLLTYLQWRDKFFTSAAGDVSLLHIFPRWLPKSLQRLLQLTMKVYINFHLPYVNMNYFVQILF
jgi:hypothetical protein